MDKQNGRKKYDFNWREEIKLLLENFCFLIPFHVVHTLRKIFRNRFTPLFRAKRNCSNVLWIAPEWYGHEAYPQQKSFRNGMYP